MVNVSSFSGISGRADGSNIPRKHRLQMECRIVTEDFVYPCDRHGNEYGWGWSLLTTPEMLYGHDACTTACSPEESFRRIVTHMRGLLPDATERQIVKMMK